MICIIKCHEKTSINECQVLKSVSLINCSYCFDVVVVIVIVVVHGLSHLIHKSSKFFRWLSVWNTFCVLCSIWSGHSDVLVEWSIFFFTVMNMKNSSVKARTRSGENDVSKINGVEMMSCDGDWERWSHDKNWQWPKSCMQYTKVVRRGNNLILCIQHPVMTAIYLNDTKTSTRNKRNETRRTPITHGTIITQVECFQLFPCLNDTKCSWFEMIHRNKVNVISINATTAASAVVA